MTKAQKKEFEDLRKKIVSVQSKLKKERVQDEAIREFVKDTDLNAASFRDYTQQLEKGTFKYEFNIERNLKMFSDYLGVIEAKVKSLISTNEKKEIFNNWIKKRKELTKKDLVQLANIKLQDTIQNKKEIEKIVTRLIKAEKKVYTGGIDKLYSKQAILMKKILDKKN